MVGPMLLIKMLHCKRLQRKNTIDTDEFAAKSTRHNQSLDAKPTEIKIKNETNEDSLCRVCLKEGNIPIYGNDMFEDISEELVTFGSIEITIDDPYPKFLCSTCNDLLQGAILFRKNALKSDEILKQPVEDLPDIDNGNDDFTEYLVKNKSVKRLRRKGKVKNKITYNCKKCQVSFNTFNEYNEHTITEEHENRKVSCPVCNKSYTSLYLKRHLAIHKQEAPYMCDICGKNFVMQGPFTRHRLTHFYKLPFQCTLCPYKGRFSESLKMHMRSHTGERPYPCTECPKKFINKSNLNKHMLTHRGEHDFKCDTCGKGFYTKRELEQHYKVDHTGLKDHVCNICGKAFGYRKQMMKHQLKVHKREKLRSGRMPLYLKVENLKQQGHDIES